MKYPKNSYIKDKDGDVRKVLEVLGDLRFLSYIEGGTFDDWETNSGSFYHVGELDRDGYEERPAPEDGERWEPKIREPYWCIDSYGDVWNSSWNDDETDNYRLRTNNVFRTRKEAEDRYKEIME